VKRWLAPLLLLAAVFFVALAAEGGEPSSLPSPPARIDPDLGIPIGQPLRSIAADASLVMDGVLEPAWEEAPPLTAPLHFGLHGREPAGVVELRSLYDAEQVYFLVRWPAQSSGGEPGVWRNLLTVHWRLVDPGQVSGVSTGSEGLACTVGCHTATADGEGHLVGIRSETIPPGLGDDLAAAGGWSKGEWLLEWSRPRVSPSPYDQNLADAEQSYRFFIKLFLGLEDRPDPTSDVHELRLAQ